MKGRSYSRERRSRRRQNLTKGGFGSFESDTLGRLQSANSGHSLSAQRTGRIDLLADVAVVQKSSRPCENSMPEWSRGKRIFAIFPLWAPRTGREVGAARYAPRSFRTVCKISASRGAGRKSRALERSSAGRNRPEEGARPEQRTLRGSPQCSLGCGDLPSARRRPLRPVSSYNRKEPPLSRHPLQEGGAVIAKDQA